MLDAGAEMTRLAVLLGLGREVIRIWFCNRRQAIKNTRSAPAMTSHEWLTNRYAGMMPVI